MSEETSERVFFLRWFGPDGSHVDGGRAYGEQWMADLARNVTGSANGNYRKAELREWLGPDESVWIATYRDGVEVES